MNRKHDLKSLDELQDRLHYYFRDKNLLARALTHRSLAGFPHNERLEFLGDAVLSQIIAELLFKRHTEANEGELSRMRSILVCGDYLVKIAQKISLGSYLRLGLGEKKSGGCRRHSILANAVEALIGALYLDAGLAVCRQLVLKLYNGLEAVSVQGKVDKDSKSQLQEYLQANHFPLPFYSVVPSGEAHAKTFYVTCCVEGLPYRSEGISSTRRGAEQVAAARYLEQLSRES